LLRALLILTTFLGPAYGLGPEVIAAAKDAVRHPHKDAVHRRYLILPEDKEYREKTFLPTLRFHLNSLSREPEFPPDVRVSERVLMVDFRAYGWKRETWERLAEVEPYLHVDAEKAAVRVEKVAVEERVWVVPVGGQGYYVTRVRYEERAVKEAPRKARAHAPWLPTAEIAYLAKALDSDAPIVRADWFVYQTAIAKGRKAGYYDWLGLGKRQEDFLELVGADLKVSAKRKKQMAASIAESGVTVQNRGIEYDQAFGGGFWHSVDFLTSVGAQNVTRVLKGDYKPPTGDASEQYGFLPNELFAYWLQNADGVRQDVAPPDIAKDKTSTSNDPQVHVMLSCVRCHVEGLRPLDDFIRGTYKAGLPAGIAQKDYDEFLRLQRLYLSDLDGQLRKDNAQFAAALKRLNGPAWTAKLNAESYGEVWRRYADAGLTLAQAAAELETTPELLLKAADAYGEKYVGEAEPLITALVNRRQGWRQRREHFEEGYPVYRLLLAGELRGAQ
jgi:hypothetical protein